MRIAHVDTGRDWRGGQAQVLMLLEGLRERGHTVALVAPDAPLARRAADGGIEWLRLKAGSDLDWTAGGRLARLVAPWRPELLHAHTARAHTLARAAGAVLEAPVIVSRRVIKPIGANPVSRRKYRSGVARYLCISTSVLDTLRRGGIAESRLALVPSAVDLDLLGAIRKRVAGNLVDPSLRVLLGAEANAVVVGAVGAMTREKGIDVFAAAAAEVLAARHDAWWVWIGDGPERRRLERESRRIGLGPRLQILGFRRDAHELMAQLTLCVSTSRTEGLGTSVLEAQALGVPVVVTDSGGVTDAVASETNGRVVTDPTRFGRDVLSALGDPATLTRWRAAALGTVQRFSVVAMVERTLAEYASVLAESAGAPAD